ncbi:arf-GAP with Rho-GAP domain, ANK repeat and PH domain-containing protein 1-like isoform X2 [Petromyzon marinus]|uniref:arf-GAP with Rho-GAP domain, ANK repeat and PH domain-containing protein 1-like isoform X2 n=1 Tax=Petromyzon marinus TaxID=7757 RepID=UPI003F6F92C0
MTDAEAPLVAWLEAISLSQYAAPLIAHGYRCPTDLVSLDNAALQALGVGLSGHRKRILNRARFCKAAMVFRQLDDDAPGIGDEQRRRSPKARHSGSADGPLNTVEPEYTEVVELGANLWDGKHAYRAAVGGVAQSEPPYLTRSNLAGKKQSSLDNLVYGNLSDGGFGRPSLTSSSSCDELDRCCDLGRERQGVGPSVSRAARNFWITVAEQNANSRVGTSKLDSCGKGYLCPPANSNKGAALAGAKLSRNYMNISQRPPLPTPRQLFHSHRPNGQHSPEVGSPATLLPPVKVPSRQPRARSPELRPSGKVGWEAGPADRCPAAPVDFGRRATQGDGRRTRDGNLQAKSGPQGPVPAGHNGPALRQSSACLNGSRSECRSHESWRGWRSKVTEGICFYDRMDIAVEKEAQPAVTTDAATQTETVARAATSPRTAGSQREPSPLKADDGASSAPVQRPVPQPRRKKPGMKTAQRVSVKRNPTQPEKLMPVSPSHKPALQEAFYCRVPPECNELKAAGADDSPATQSPEIGTDACFLTVPLDIPAARAGRVRASSEERLSNSPSPKNELLPAPEKAMMRPGNRRRKERQGDSLFSDDEVQDADDESKTWLGLPDRSPSHLSVRSDTQSLLSLSDDHLPGSPRHRGGTSDGETGVQGNGTAGSSPCFRVPNSGSAGWFHFSAPDLAGPVPLSKAGWLDKQPPGSGYRFQRRWVKFEGDYLTYYNNEKEVYSKGVIHISAILRVDSTSSDAKFEVRTPHRTFTFRADTEAEKCEWVSVLQRAARERRELGAASPAPPSVSTASPAATSPYRPPPCERSGFLELKGCRQALFVAVAGERTWLYKNRQDFHTGVGITAIDMNVATVKDVDRRSFELTTPYKTFIFTVDMEADKEEWMEALRESTAEALSTHDIADRIWALPANRLCADCGAAKPAWASINLCVVICKLCAGQHRALGPNISKVRSLKMDKKIWTDDLIELFVQIGNERVNEFWAANVPPSEEIDPASMPNERREFVVAKYRSGKYRRYHEFFGDQAELNRALCSAVVTSDVLESMALVYCGADVTGAPGCSPDDDPLLLAEQAGQKLQLQMLLHNRNLDTNKPEPSVGNRSIAHTSGTPFCTGYLHKASTSSKAVTEPRARDDFSRRRCVLEAGVLSYFDSDRSVAPSGKIDLQTLSCLALTSPDSDVRHGFAYTMELYARQGDSEKVYLFGTDSEEMSKEWSTAVVQAFVSAAELGAGGLMSLGLERVGRASLRDGCAREARQGWLALAGPCLHFRAEPTLGDARATALAPLRPSPIETLQLNKLQELGLANPAERNGQKEVLLLREKRRTLYLQCSGRADFAGWHAAVRRGAAGRGGALATQQLTDADVPVTVDTCIAFITQHGLAWEGVYRKAGVGSRVSALLAAFREDARSVQPRAGETQLDDVATVLRRFLRESDDAVVPCAARSRWVDAAGTRLAVMLHKQLRLFTRHTDLQTRVAKYGSLLQDLPSVNRATLTALVEHLHSVQLYSVINHMTAQNLAIVFAPSIFHSEGDSSSEAALLEELITNYAAVFEVSQEQLMQRKKETDYIVHKFSGTAFKQAPAGDMIIEVYFQKKDTDCNLGLKVSAFMTAEELTCEVLERRGISPEQGPWDVFEVVSNGELERPLHYREKVLDLVLQWCNSPDFQTNYLLVRPHPARVHMQRHLANRKVDTWHGLLRFREEGGWMSDFRVSRFHEKYFMFMGHKLVMYKDTRTNKGEKEWNISSLKIYLGMKKRLKPPTEHCFTIFQGKQQWYLCCDKEADMRELYASILHLQHNGDVWPVGRSTEEQKSADERQPTLRRLGALSLIPLCGSEADIRRSVAPFYEDG